MPDTPVYLQSHAANIPIIKMVLNRLPFLQDTEGNRAILSQFIYEVMGELEPCFKIDLDLPEGDESRIGDEQYYNVAQRGVIADIVAYYMILLAMGAATGGTGEDEAAAGTYLKRAKAGSVEVEYAQFDTKTGSLGFLSSGDKLIEMFLNSAVRKAYAMGCILAITPDGIEVTCEACTTLPFITGKFPC